MGNLFAEKSNDALLGSPLLSRYHSPCFGHRTSPVSSHCIVIFFMVSSPSIFYNLEFPHDAAATVTNYPKGCSEYDHPMLAARTPIRQARPAMNPSRGFTLFYPLAFEAMALAAGVVIFVIWH